ERIAVFCEPAFDVGYDVHHMAVSFDEKLVRDRNGTDSSDAADIVAAKVQQHQMFGAFFWVREQFFGKRLVFRRRCTTMTCACDRADRDDVSENFHEFFWTRPRHCKAAKIQKIKIG